jgi:hypothetical protein
MALERHEVIQVNEVPGVREELVECSAEVVMGSCPWKQDVWDGHEILAVFL